MPLFDQEKMVQLVSELRKSSNHLRELSKLDKEGLIKDPDKIGSTKYNFIVAIESCIDMCNHIISRNGFRAPDSYSDTFKVMGEIGALDKDFANEMISMAKFRNRLVHLYWEVDNDLLYNILKTRLDDFKQFINQISQFLEWNKPDKE